MVSDIVLLKELPEEIKNSVTAYIGCLAGAVTKNEYLGDIRAAGFKETRIIDETTTPAELLANDPSARQIVKSMNLSREQAKDLARSVIRVKVSAIKPAAQEEMK